MNETMTDQTEETLPTKLEVDGISVDLDTRVQFMVGLPAGLRIALDMKARESKVPVAQLVREALRDATGYKGSLGGTSVSSKKYGSKDEQKAAQKERQKARRGVVNSLISKYLEDDDEEEPEEDEA